MSSLVEQAVTFESIRRRLLDLYQSWGYELVVPPMVEYIESLDSDFKLCRPKNL